MVKISNSGPFVIVELAGWSMAVGAWLAVSSPRTIAQIAMFYIVTVLIGLSGLHRSIGLRANSAGKRIRP